MKSIIAVLAAALTITAQAAITGAGASFPAPVYFKWAEAYKQATGKEVNYQSIGSSGGIKQIGRKTVDFGASDVARSEADLKKDGQVQFPTVMGGVVIVVNLPGVEKNQLNLTTDQVGKLFAGKVSNWKDLDSSLPDLPVTVAHRADGSGTTAIFTTYLAENAKDFHLKAGKTVRWEGNTVGGKGNAGDPECGHQTTRDGVEDLGIAGIVGDAPITQHEEQQDGHEPPWRAGEDRRLARDIGHERRWFG